MIVSFVSENVSLKHLKTLVKRGFAQVLGELLKGLLAFVARSVFDSNIKLK